MIDYFGADAIGRFAEDVVQNEKMASMIEKALLMPEEEFADLTQEFNFGEKILSVRCIPFRDRLNRNLGTITVMNDITSLKKIDQLKSDFVSMVAHELRSPLNSIGMQLKVILDGLAGGVTEKQQEILGRASEKIVSLSNLSADLLDLAKIKSGLITQEKEKIKVDELLRELVDFFQEDARAKNIILEIDEIINLSPVLVNRDNIVEVFSNLINNSIKYSPKSETDNSGRCR